jgi:hypothetical protein
MARQGTFLQVRIEPDVQELLRHANSRITGDIPILLIIDEIGRAKFRLNSTRSSRQTLMPAAFIAVANQLINISPTSTFVDLSRR